MFAHEPFRVHETMEIFSTKRFSDECEFDKRVDMFCISGMCLNL